MCYPFPIPHAVPVSPAGPCRGRWYWDCRRWAWLESPTEPERKEVQPSALEEVEASVTAALRAEEPLPVATVEALPGVALEVTAGQVPGMREFAEPEPMVSAWASASEGC